MNIKDLKALIAKLPDDIDSAQFSQIELEVESLLAEQRRAEEAELAAIEQHAAKLREKLGVKAATPVQAAPPPVRPPRPTRDGGETDFDNGVGDDFAEQSASGFRAELTAIRDRNVSRRRREH